MEHLPEDLSVGELFRYQQRLARSHDLLERPRTLWIGALLGVRLESCSDQEIGDLLSLAQDGLGIFSAEFAVCEHARRRLQRRNLWR